MNWFRRDTSSEKPDDSVSSPPPPPKSDQGSSGSETARQIAHRLVSDGNRAAELNVKVVQIL
jgi:hypothetical protein